MFFYVSFLRPPPTRAPLSSPLLITLHISNDLRTEPCEIDQDIFYDWVFVDYGLNNAPRTASAARVGPPRGTAGNQLGMKKLMTWRNANAYREIPIPVPQGVREGQQWKLVLTAVPVGGSGGTSSARTTSFSGGLIPLNIRIHMDEEKIGRWLPFGVSSMPVTFTYASRGAPKQEEIERTYEFKVAGVGAEDGPQPINSASAAPNLRDISNRLKGLQVEDKECPQGKSKTVRLVIREQTSFDLDKKIWDSGIGLSAWLVQWLNGLSSVPQTSPHGADAAKSLLDFESIFTSTGNLNILELGSGTGILALTVAALRSRIADAEDRILTTDLDSAIPLLEHNINSNNSILSDKITLKAGVLDWGQNLMEQLPDETSFDLVVMADVTYNTDSFPALIRTLTDVRNMNPDKKSLFLMGYKERHDEERTLWDLAKAMGIDFVQVGTIPGHVSGGAPIEIWIG